MTSGASSPALSGNAGNCLGILGGYQSAALDMSDRASTGEVSAYHHRPPGGGMIGPVSIRAGFSTIPRPISTPPRTVAFTGFSQGLASTSGAGVSQPLVRRGRLRLQRRAGSLEPYAGFGWIGLDVDPATETGGSAASMWRAAMAISPSGTLGVRSATGSEGPWSFVARPHGGTTSGHHPGRPAMFAAGTTVFSVSPPTPCPKDAGLIGAGVEWRSGRTSISAFYSGQFADGQTDHGFTADDLYRIGRLAGRGVRDYRDFARPSSFSGSLFPCAPGSLGTPTRGR